MKVINFNTLAVEDVKITKSITIKLELDELLDLPYSQFLPALGDRIEKLLKDSIKSNIPHIIHIQTDLDRTELEYCRQNILGQLVLLLTKDKIQRHEEKRLGTMGFDAAEINYLQFMDLVNYKTPFDSFDVIFYDKQKRLCSPLLSRKD